MSVKDVTLRKTLKIIEKRANVGFFYSSTYIDLDVLITKTFADSPLEHILKTLFEPLKIDFILQSDSKSIVLLERRETEEKSLPALSGKVVADEKKIERVQLKPVTGTVTDEEGVALAGVSVVIRRTTNGVDTDKFGRYIISVPDTASLVFSLLGYKSFTTKVGSSNFIDVQLQELSTNLDEVLILASGITNNEKKSTRKGKIKAAEIAKQLASNALLTLPGRMPGVLVAQENGLPGSAVTIQIRGRNSLNQLGNEPLYLVDGVPYPATSVSPGYAISPYLSGINPVNSLNAGVIESIEILKDADATASYGSRGVNGVVLITTKKGEPEKTRITANVYRGVGKVTRTMDLLNTEQWLEMRHEAFKNDGVMPNQNNAPDLLLWDTTHYTDWQKKLIGNTAAITNIQSSISGGDKTTQFFSNAALYKETTVYPGDEFGYQKGSAHINVTHKALNKRLKASLTMSYTGEKNKLPQTDLASTAFRLPPNAPKIYSDDGTLNWENSTWSNPYSLLNAKYKANTQSFILSGSLSYNIAKGFQIRANLGSTDTRLDEISVTPSTSYNPAFNIQGSSIFSKSSFRSWIIEPAAEYELAFNRSKVNFVVGSTLQQNLSKNEGVEATGFKSDANLESLKMATDILVLDANDAEYRYAAAFSRINYSFQEKYFVNLTARLDASSRFAPGRQVAKFWAIGTDWIFSQEPFVRENFSFLSFGKLGLSHGTTGSDQIEDYQHLVTYSPTEYSYAGSGGLIPDRIVDSDLSWQMNRKNDASVELGFFKNRLFLIASYYHNISYDQIVDMAAPAFLGHTSVKTNQRTKVANTGWEFELGAKIKGAKISWETNVNLTVPKNAIVAYPALANSSHANRYVVGKPMSMLKRIHITGVDPDTGIYSFEDLNNNGTLDYPEDLQALRDLNPSFYGGFQNSLTYKGIKLDILLQFVKGLGFNYMRTMEVPPGSRRSNQPTTVMDRWQKPGDASQIQKFTQNFGSAPYRAYINSFDMGDNVLSDASYVRLKNISISWELPSKYIQKARIQNFRIYLQAQNLFTFSRYLGDPETQSTTSLPPLKVVATGLEITF